MADPVVQTLPLGVQWLTVDQFLFCVHHDDTYPAANDRFGPAASLAGRSLSMDFSGQDGWSAGRRGPRRGAVVTARSDLRCPRAVAVDPASIPRESRGRTRAWLSAIAHANDEVGGKWP